MEYPRGVLIEENKRDTEAITIQRDCIAVRELDGLPLRIAGNFSEVGYFLSSRINWIVVKDDEDELVLIPIKKEKS